MKKDKKQVVTVYLLKKYVIDENGSSLALKVGHTSKEKFLRVLGSGEKARGDSYNTHSAPVSKGYEFLGEIQAPRILENMFHVKYNNDRFVNSTTNRKSEWMNYSDSAVEDFFQADVFNCMCEYINNNRSELLSGNKNAYVKKEVSDFLDKWEKDEVKFKESRSIEILKQKKVQFQNRSKEERLFILERLLSNKPITGLDLLK